MLGVGVGVSVVARASRVRRDSCDVPQKVANN
ncbi:hypothetical protein XAP6164_5560008 [Xanthomonas phaseoli pv. phaseoli]|nr:hypothetical protein XAP6164_5560008 [Xanthomonas phaseoli pv. phaseoli]